MGLEALLATLERREAVTPVTPRYPDGVTGKAAPDKACTRVTPVIPVNDGAGTGADVEASPVPDCRAVTPVETAELRALVGLILADGSEDERAEALAVALADPDAALMSFRALTSVGNDPRMRRCIDCGGFALASGKCLQAATGASFGAGIAVSRNHARLPLQAVRCAAFLPRPDDPDRRMGAERWPILTGKD